MYKWAGMGVALVNKNIYRRDDILPADIPPAKIRQWLRKGVIVPIAGYLEEAPEMTATIPELPTVGIVSEVVPNLDLGVGEVALTEEEYSLLDNAKPTVIVPEKKTVSNKKPVKRGKKGKKNA